MFALWSPRWNGYLVRVEPHLLTHRSIVWAQTFDSLEMIPGIIKQANAEMLQDGRWQIRAVTEHEMFVEKLKNPQKSIFTPEDTTALVDFLYRNLYANRGRNQV